MSSRIKVRVIQRDCYALNQGLIIVYLRLLRTGSLLMTNNTTFADEYDPTKFTLEQCWYPLSGLKLMTTVFKGRNLIRMTSAQKPLLTCDSFCIMGFVPILMIKGDLKLYIDQGQFLS